MIGNLSLAGRVFVGGGKSTTVCRGPRYNLASFRLVKPKGLNSAARPPMKPPTNTAKVAAGVSPRQGAWYPFVAGQLTGAADVGAGGISGYGLKARISNMTNPWYGIAGLRGVAEERLKDPARLPLLIAIDAFINETTAWPTISSRTPITLRAGDSAPRAASPARPPLRAGR
ncbi:hypothetical protein M8494_04775 [Serratia ureilytica]